MSDDRAVAANWTVKGPLSNTVVRRLWRSMSSLNGHAYRTLIVNKSATGRLAPLHTYLPAATIMTTVSGVKAISLVHLSTTLFISPRRLFPPSPSWLQARLPTASGCLIQELRRGKTSTAPKLFILAPSPLKGPLLGQPRPSTTLAGSLLGKNTVQCLISTKMKDTVENNLMWGKLIRSTEVIAVLLQRNQMYQTICQPSRSPTIMYNLPRRHL